MKSPSLSSPLVGVEMIGARGVSTVMIWMLQLSMLPAAMPPASTTNRLQTPFGSVELKFAKAEVIGPLTGPGAPYGSPGSKSVGLKVPLASVFESGNEASACSSSVKFRSVTALAAPPTSLSNVTACPVGPTRSTSTSTGEPWLKPDSVTLTAVTPLGRPLTPMHDGYGVAGPDALIVVALSWLKVPTWAWAPRATTRTEAAAAPAVAATSRLCRVALR